MTIRAHPLFKLLTRPAVALAIIVGAFMLLFPNWGPRDLALFVRLPPERCASEITASAFSGEVLARSLKRPIHGEPDLTSTFSLPRADYRLVVELACADG